MVARDYRHTKRSIQASKRLGYEVVEMDVDWCNGPCCMSVERHSRYDSITFHLGKKKHKSVLVRLEQEDDDPEFNPNRLVALLSFAFVANLIWFLN